MNNKKKPKDILTKKQFDIIRRGNEEIIKTNEWLASEGICSDTLNTTHIRLLQAQQQAHALLTHHQNLLTDSQRTTLERFSQQMRQRRKRSQLKPEAANAVLNISSKINRQLFRQYRQLTKT